MKSVIVYGPQGCGKTTHATAMLKYFKLRYVEDLESHDVRAVRTENTLYLSQDEATAKGRGLDTFNFEDIKGKLK